MDNVGTRLELNHFHQKVNVWVAEQQQIPSQQPKSQVSTVVLDNSKKSYCKPFQRNTYFT